MFKLAPAQVLQLRGHSAILTPARHCPGGPRHAPAPSAHSGASHAAPPAHQPAHVQGRIDGAALRPLYGTALAAATPLVSVQLVIAHLETVRPAKVRNLVHSLIEAMLREVLLLPKPIHSQQAPEVAHLPATSC